MQLLWEKGSEKVLSIFGPINLSCLLRHQSFEKYFLPKNNIHPSSLNETNEPIFEFEDGRMKEYDELLNDLKKSELDL